MQYVSLYGTQTDTKCAKEPSKVVHAIHYRDISFFYERTSKSLNALRWFATQKKIVFSVSMLLGTKFSV